MKQNTPNALPRDGLFHRPSLAVKMTKSLLDAPAASAVRSGLFLAAPRRTGKSTFLRRDLRPAMEAKGALVLYADLWEDKKDDPGEVIMNTIRACLARHDGAILRLFRKNGLDKVKVGGLQFLIDKVGLGKDISLSTALFALSNEMKRPIVLMIDEAQHALNTEAGRDALFALKAARDKLNSETPHGLYLLATGSSRNKLASMCNDKSQAFYGAPVAKFPMLGEDYVRWFCKNAGIDGLDEDRCAVLFRQCGRRPEMLGAAADELRLDFNLEKADTQERFEALVRERIESAARHVERVVDGLTPLQEAVLRVIVEQGQDYAPFMPETLQAVARHISSISPESRLKPTNQNTQQALIALQSKGLVWRARRGVYEVEDESVVVVCQKKMDAAKVACEAKACEKEGVQVKPKAKKSRPGF